MTKFEWLAVLVVAVVFGGLLVGFDRARLARHEEVTDEPTSAVTSYSLADPFESFSGGELVAAPGRIEGQTETAELRARLAESIIEVTVSEGDWVAKGAPLVRLDRAPYQAERNLAQAELRRAESRLQRLVNGARSSELDELRGRQAAALAEFEGAEKAYARVVRLDQGQAASGQTVDEHATRLRFAAAQLEVAQARLATLEAPPREEDLEAAGAQVAAAQSRLELAEVRLGQTELVAPAAGHVLEVNGRLGEVTRPDQREPLIRFADTSRLRVRAEVDEYDAMRVAAGQNAVIRTDSLPGRSLYGSVVRIGPRVHRKRLFEDRPGERLDSYLRDVWIEFDTTPELPVGLPVDVFVAVTE